MNDSIKKQLEAGCSPKGVTAQFVEFFYINGRIRRDRVIQEIGMLALAVIVSVAMSSSYRAHSYVWMALTALILFVVVVLCFRPIIFAVTSYRGDRHAREEAWARVPQRLHSRETILRLEQERRQSRTLTPEKRTALEGMKSIAAIRGESLEVGGKDVALFCLYVIEHQDDLKTLGLFLRLLAGLDSQPNLDKETREFVSQARTLLTSTFGESALADAEKQGASPAGVGTHLKSLLSDVSMDKKKVEYYRKRLLTKQEELLRVVTTSEREGRQADEEARQDIADKAANSHTKESLFHLSDENSRVLQLVNEALERMKDGTYGICVNCLEAVQQKRLEAVPWARHCIGCQQKQDQGLLSQTPPAKRVA